MEQDIKRYHFDQIGMCDCYMSIEDDGEWVRYEDIQELIAEYRELKEFYAQYKLMIG